MNVRNTIVAVATAVLAVGGAGASGAEPVDIAFGEKGLTSLTHDGTEYLADGRLRVTGAFFRKPDGRVYAADLEEARRTVDPEAKEVTLRFPWGRVAAGYAAKGGRLSIDVRIANHREHEPLVGLYVQPLRLKLPGNPKITNRSYLFYMNSSVAHNRGSPGIVGADVGSALLALCNEQLAQPLAFGLGEPVSGDQRVRPLLAYTARHPMNKKRFPFIERPVRPGGTDRWALSVRFGGKRASLTGLTADLYEAYGRLYPRTLEWEDRGPIAQIFVAGGGNLPQPSNPRGYRTARKLDLRTEEGRRKFRKETLDWAAKCTEICKGMNAQGVIVWNLEGQEYKHPITYLGDPRSLPPEMEGVADDLFQVFRDAGLRTGLTIRPSMPLRAAYDGKVKHRRWSARVRHLRKLNKKIQYAKKRWDCTIFYIDSNVRWYQDPYALPGVGSGGGHTALVDTRALARLQRAHPDVLLIPEHETLASYAYGAPYVEAKGAGSVRLPRHVRETYPGAFRSINLKGKEWAEKHRRGLIEAVQRGDLMFAHGWWTPPRNKAMKRIYREAGRWSEKNSGAAAGQDE